MPEIALVVVPAFYRNAAGALVEALPENRLLAADVAPKWSAWRERVRQMYGWEILIAPPNSGNYTRAIFRTPADQSALQTTGTAAALDASPHQAGRAVDVDLYGMAALYPGFSETALVDAARVAGMFQRVAGEPWHFDDNPRAIFGDTNAAIKAVGNTTAQVLAAIQAGLDTPQIAAVKAWLKDKAQNPLLWVALAAGAAFYFASRRKQRGQRVQA